MNVLSLLRTDFLELCRAMVSESLHKLDLRFEDKATVCKYVVPAGYPEKRMPGGTVYMDDVPSPSETLRIYYAAVEGTLRRPVMTGSRAVAFLGIADTVAEAAEIAESAIQKIGGGQVRHRSDVGSSALLRSRVENMRRLMRG